MMLLSWCLLNFFLLVMCFQCSQTGQSRNDSPWFFDLNPLLFTCSSSNEYFYNGVARFLCGVLRHKFLILDLKQIVFAVLMMFVLSLLTLTEFLFYFYQAQRVSSQWTQTGKPTNDFSMLLQLQPSTISWSIQRIYLYLGWSNVYNIHSLIHCCSTLELIIFVKNKSKTNPTGNSFPTSVHWFFVSYLMCYQEAFNVETVHVKMYMISKQLHPNFR